jgi:acetoin utilization protein AcuB
MFAKTLLQNRPKRVITATPDTTIEEAMGILIENRIGCLPIVENGGKLVGILGDQDIFMKVYETRGQYQSLTVKDVMKTDLIVALPEDDISYIAAVMEKNWLRCVPIVKGGTVIGIVSLRDISKTLVQNVEVDNRYLMNMLEKRDKSGDI